MWSRPTSDQTPPGTECSNICSIDTVELKNKEDLKVAATAVLLILTNKAVKELPRCVAFSQSLRKPQRI